jgi:chromosome segregation ATPase
MKHYLITTITIALCGFANLAHAQRPLPVNVNVDAQEVPTVRLNVQDRTNVNAELREQREDLTQRRRAFNADMQEQRNALRTERDVQKQEFRSAIQSAQTPEEREALLEEAQAAREALKTEAEVLRAEARTVRSSFASEKSQLILQRYEAVMQRVEDITLRIEERMLVLESEGYDVSEASSLLSDAKALVEEAASNFASAQRVYDSIDFENAEAEEIKSLIQESRQYLSTTKERIKEAWVTARSATESLKSLQGSNEA